MRRAVPEAVAAPAQEAEVVAAVVVPEVVALVSAPAVKPPRARAAAKAKAKAKAAEAVEVEEPEVEARRSSRKAKKPAVLAYSGRGVLASEEESEESEEE